MVWKSLTVQVWKYTPVFGDGSERLLWDAAVINTWDVFALIIVLFTQRKSNKFSSHTVCMAVFSFHVRDGRVVLQHYMDCFHSVILAVSSLKAPSLSSSITTLLTSQNLPPFPFTDDCFRVTFMQILFFSVNITWNPSLHSSFLSSFLSLLISILSFHSVVRFCLFFCCSAFLIFRRNMGTFRMLHKQTLLWASTDWKCNVFFWCVVFCLPWYLPTYLWKRMVMFKVQIHF